MKYTYRAITDDLNTPAPGVLDARGRLEPVLDRGYTGLTKAQWCDKTAWDVFRISGKQKQYSNLC
jgi:hypothetical protein